MHRFFRSTEIRKPYRALLWICFNIIGFSHLFPIFQYLGVSIAGNGIRLLADASLVWLSQAFEIALFQILFLMLFTKKRSLVRWLFLTWLAIFLMNFIHLGIVSSIFRIFINISGSLPFITAFLGGFIVVYENDPIMTFMFSGMFGLGMGVIDGLILGLGQSLQFKDRKFKSQWFWSVVLSFVFSYLVNSLVIACDYLVFDTFPWGGHHVIWRYIVPLLGLVYSLFTCRLIGSPEMTRSPENTGMTNEAVI